MSEQSEPLDAKDNAGFLAGRYARAVGFPVDPAGNVASAYGFSALAVTAGIRALRPDLALIASDQAAVFSGMFTTNYVKAAPVLLTQAVHERGRSWGAIVNSGNANALTGPQGWTDACSMQEQAAELLHSTPAETVVASTGVIGMPLPMDRVSQGIQALAMRFPVSAGDRLGEARTAAEAILTTDTVPKTGSVTLELSRGMVHLGMMVKGSGMIHPNMATMLGFFTTDAFVAKPELDMMVRRAVDRSFHRISVDGDTSTNDMVLVWANGASGVALESAEDLARFEAALTALMVTGARAVAADGEGATRLLTMRVVGAADEADAAAKARATVRSNLVKAAVFGRDPNWGRVLAAVGTVGAPFDAAGASLSMNGLDLFRQGAPAPLDEDEARHRMEAAEVVFELDLGQGSGSAEAWGCDLTDRYVSINAHYRT